MTSHAGESVNRIELALRTAIRLALPAWREKLGEDKVRKLEERAAVEQKRRDGTIASPDLLDFAHHFQLTDLVLSNWEAFKPIFDDKKRTEVYLALLDDFRNGPMHSRELVEFERDLLSGAAGQLSNQVAIYRSSSSDLTRSYPLIESAVDNFDRPGTDPTLLVSSQPAMRFAVGEEVCVMARAALSGRDFPPRWSLQVAEYVDVEGAEPPDSEWIDGEQVAVPYVFQPSDIGERSYLHLVLSTKSKHHRHHVRGIGFPHDDVRSWMVAVDPPHDE